MPHVTEQDEARRERIIQRATDTLAQLQAKIRKSLDELRVEDGPGDFEEELGDVRPDEEESQLRHSVQTHELEVERARWREITEISERNRAARPDGGD